MRAHPAIPGAGRKPFWRRRRFWHVTVPVGALGAALIAGLLVYNAFFGANGVTNAKGWGVTYPTPTPPRTVKLDGRILPLVTRFMETAVARKDLDSAYGISGPAVLEGMTRAQWRTGDIAVVPFPVDSRTRVTLMKIDYSYARRAELRIFLVTPGRIVTSSPHTFTVDLIERNNHWLVNSWVPLWTPPIPVA